MVLKFKQRGINDVKKVLIYGGDGSGKSTFAAEYCKENGLNPVVIDIDDTNYTTLPIVDIDLSSDMTAYKNIIRTIKEVTPSQFDTIILDGVTSLLEILTSKAKGIKKYSDRAERFSAILNALIDSHKNLIFIGQIDMKVIHNEEFQSPKPVVKINSIVNEKYLCLKEKNNYTHEVEKYRAVESTVTQTVPAPKKQVKVVNETASQPKVQDSFVTADVIGEPKPEDDPIRNSCIEIKKMLENEGKAVTKFSMRLKVVKLIEEELLPAENKAPLCDYINKHCPEELPQ